MDKDLNPNLTIANAATFRPCPSKHSWLQCILPHKVALHLRTFSCPSGAGPKFQKYRALNDPRSSSHVMTDGSWRIHTSNPLTSWSRYSEASFFSLSVSLPLFSIFASWDNLPRKQLHSGSCLRVCFLELKPRQPCMMLHYHEN